MSGFIDRKQDPTTVDAEGSSAPAVITPEGQVRVRVEDMQEVIRLLRELVFHARIITGEEYEDEDH